jgi:hypothetical protein
MCVRPLLGGAQNYESRTVDSVSMERGERPNWLVDVRRGMTATNRQGHDKTGK